MNYEKYIDKAFGLFQALLLALMTALFSGLAYLTLHYKTLEQIQIIIISSGLAVLLVGYLAFAFTLAKMLKELKGG